MKKTFHIPVFVLIMVLQLSQGFAQEFSAESPIFTFDTKKPVVEVISPNGGESINEAGFIVQWQATDENFGNEPVSVYIKYEPAGSFELLASNIQNTGNLVLNTPDVSSNNAELQILVIDAYGNQAVDESDALFYINAGAGIISGLVTNDITMEPVEGATVLAKSGNMNYYAQPTNANGDYEIHLPFGYGYILKANAGNYDEKVIANVNVLEGQVSPEVFFELYPLSGVYEVRDLKIDPNPTVSTVMAGSIFHRYYMVSDQITNKKASGIEVKIESEGDIFTVQSDENGMIDFSLPSDQIGTGEPNSSRQFNITKVNGLVITEPIQFTCEVEDIVYEKYWDNKQFQKIGANLLTLDVTLEREMGAVTTLVEEDGNNGLPEFVKINRQARAGGGVGFKAKAPGAKAQLGPLKAGVGAEAGVGAKFLGLTEDMYKYNHEISDDWEAISQYILIADGNYNLIDHAMNRLLIVLQDFFTDQTSLDEAFLSDAVGIDVMVYAEAEAEAGVEASKNIKLGAGANIGTEGHVTFNAVNHYAEDETEFNFGVSGTFASNAEAGLKVDFDGDNKNDLKTMINIWDTHSQRGMEFSIYLDQLNLNHLSKFEIKYIRKSNLFEEEVLYTVDGEAALVAISGLTNEIQQLYDANVNGSNITVDDNTFKELTESIFDFLYQIQINETGDANISYIKNLTEITNTSSFELDLGLSISAAALEIGGGAGFEQGRKMTIEQGKWIYGNRYKNQEFTGVIPDIPENYQEVLQHIIDEVPMALRITQGVFNIISKIWKSDSLYFVGDNGSFVVLPDSSFPSDIDSISCISWSWYGDAPSKKVSSLSAEKQYIYKDNRKQSEAIYGMQYGIGGFYQFEPYSTDLADTAWLTILYSQEEADSLDESSLGMYWEDKSNHEWVFLGGIVDTVNNTVTSPITQLSMFTIAPAMPYGMFGLHAIPDSIYADSISFATIVSDTILNNNLTPVSDGELFTVSTSLGNIISADADTSIVGVQVQVANNRIQFEVMSGLIGGEASLFASSVKGSASATTTISYYDTIPPLPPVLISGIPDSTTTYLSWETNTEVDIAGYKIYFDTDTLAPFDGIHTVFGKPSPISLGTDSTYKVKGLFNDTTYYFAVTAIDVVGNESDYSNFIDITPFVPSRQQIQLTQGWSGISSYIDPVTDNVEPTFQNILTDLIILQNETGMYWPGQNVNTLGTWNTHEGYQIKVANAVELTISGLWENNNILQLAQGWNLIPVLSECEVDVATLFEGVNVSIVKEVAGWNVYWPEFGINTLGVLEPGKAYFVLMGEVAEITFPECAGLKGNSIRGGKTGMHENTRIFSQVNGLRNEVMRTAITHSIAIPINALSELQPGSIIGAYDAFGRCCGFISCSSESAALTLFGDDPLTSEKDGLAEGEPIDFKCFDMEANTETKLHVVFNESMPDYNGSFKTNGLSAIKSLTIGTNTQNGVPFSEIWIYPNPTTGLLQIGGIDGDYRVEVFNAVQEAIFTAQLSGNDQLDLSAFPKGMYLIKITTNDFSLTKKVVVN